jgi:hypothetical protein
MARTFTQYDELQAIAAMPGLETLADAICGPGGDFDAAMNEVIFRAVRWVFGGTERASSTLSHPGSTDWAMMREAANGVGRELTRKPPTVDKSRHFNDRFHVPIGLALADALVPAMKLLTHDVGLLLPSEFRDLANLRRENLVTGDGSVPSAMSNVKLNPKSRELTGSRASCAEAARLSDQYFGKDDGRNTPELGVPVTILAARSHLEGQRVILAVGSFHDRDETGSALTLFDSVVDVYGAGVHGFVYDSLLAGAGLQTVAHCGAVPFAPMPNAGEKDRHVELKTDQSYRRGTRTHPKTRAKFHFVATVSCGRCNHDLWALDGELVQTLPGQTRPSADASRCHEVAARFDQSSGTNRLIATYRVECSTGSFHYEVDLTGTLAGSKRLVLNYLRPQSSDAAVERLRHLRNDSESTFAHLERNLDHGRVSRLESDQFLADLVGYAIWWNARAWDVHAGHVSDWSRAEHERITRRQHRREPLSLT